MKLERSFKLRTIARRTRLFALAPLAIVLIAPLAAHAQGTPLDTGFTNLQNLFTGIRDGAPNLINYDLKDGTYIIPKILDRGYVEIGKKRMEFERKQGQ